MRIRLCILVAVAVVSSVACYVIGYRSGIRQSRLEEEQRGLVIFSLAGYKAMEATNWSKIKSLLTVEILAFTRDYERRFGAPIGTNMFAMRFAEAKAISDREEKLMVPIGGALQSALGSNVNVNSK